MATPDQSKGDRSRDEVLAGEYVLGVLNLSERQQVEARLRHDRQFAAIVRRWETNLAHFNDEYDEETPSAVIFAEIERRIFGPGLGRTSSGPWGAIWNSLPLWRGLSVAAIGTLALLLGLQWASELRPKPGSRLTAELAGKDSAISLVAQYDEASGRLAFTPVANGGAEEKSLELWLVEGEQPPTSLGILPQTGQGEIVIPDEMRPRLTGGVVLAVSVEPLGGSPTGKATGPIVAAGEILR
ncbi:anti-sigma factor [Rhizobium sp. SL42]|uniref:anti-sigma factor n=1 Tax=Rhizobium sp. SL42 TaxID=2806346 RepID=UPI001EFF6A84|nr:anti-sigma factor [Rhizobium sp. SL42]UJW75883.1 anti-sigma factor [Rhizobium sp. SL42]